MAPMEAPIWQWGPDMAPLSAHINLGFVVEYWPFVGACERHSHSKLYHCIILLLCLAFATTHPTPALILSTSLYITSPILMNSMKKIKN